MKRMLTNYRAVMATTMSHVDGVDTDPIVCLRAGASIVQTKPIFSHDSKYLFCASGCSVKVYSTDSGECVRQLHAHTQQVTGLALNPANKLQLLSCSLDQQVLFWDYSDGVVLKICQFPLPLYGLVHVKTEGTQVNFTVLQRGVKKNDHNEGSVVTYSLTGKDGQVQQETMVFSSCHCDRKTVAAGVKGTYYAAISRNQRELIISFNKKHIAHKMYYEKLTCVAAHPTDQSLVTGCSDGKIIYWYSFTDKQQVARTFYHWHSLAVIDLTFSPQGSYLLSGGHECTLVKWQYETHFKDFLPRLGSPIEHITTSPDNRMYAVAHQDNGIHLVRNTLQICQIYQGLTWTSDHLGNQVGLLWDPRSGALVSNGRPGHLQFYCLHSDKQLFNLDIVQQNYISSENLQKPLTVTQITRAAIDERGDWLVTYELWDDGVMSPWMQLKFWLYNSESQRYILNTVVDRPHEGSICSLKFRPYNAAIPNMLPLVVSAGKDRKFKQWTLVDDTDIYRSNNKWTCDSVGFYREMEVGETAFAEDGSLIAVVFQSTITLWDPDTNVLRTSLSSSYTDNVSHVLFGRNTCCHLLVSTTEEYLYVWNLLTCSVQFRVDICASVLVDDPCSQYMGVFTDSGDLHVFEPSNPKPVFSQKKTSKSKITTAIFLPHKEESSAQGKLFWQRRSQLYFMTDEQQLLTIQFKDDDNSSDRKKVQIKQNLPQSALSLLVSRHRKSDVKDSKHKLLDMSVGSREIEFIRQMLNASFQAQPPVQSLCQAFMETRLSKNNSGNHDTKMETMDIDEDEDTKTENQHGDSDSDLELEQRSRPSLGKPGKEDAVGSDSTVEVTSVDVALSRQYSWFDSISS